MIFTGEEKSCKHCYDSKVKKKGQKSSLMMMMMMMMMMMNCFCGMIDP